MQSEPDGQMPNPDPCPDADPELNQAAEPPPDDQETDDSRIPEEEKKEDDGETSDLTAPQLRSIDLAIHGVTDVQIAKTLGISRKTLWRWKTLDDDYRRRLAKTRGEVQTTNSDRYHVLLHKATGVLSKFMEDPAEQNQFRAAQIVLAMAGCFKIDVSKACQREPMPLPGVPPDMA